MRLQKFLADAGIGSRRACEALIKEGLVEVNKTRAALGQRVIPGCEVRVRGKIVKPVSHVYLAFHKPRGVLSTASDPFGRIKVTDFFEGKERIYPVGRLDKDSEGLMLLTNDGDLAYRLTHPKFRVQKVYEVKVQGIPAPEALKKIRSGVLLEDGMTAPCGARITRITDREKNAVIEIKIHEGRKREIRRMLASVGTRVISLKRTAIGPIRLLDLSPGQWRFLSEKEIGVLKDLDD